MSDERKTKVLLLDDEKFLLNMYKTKFEKSGYDVSIYNDADGALSALRAGYAPDIVLFDITMPDGRSGYEFLESVQRERLVPRAMKVALTNEGQDGVRERLAELRADGHLIKSKYIPSELVDTVAEMFALKKK